MRASIHGGEWPLWDPFSFGGASFTANSQNQLYYPLTWLLWLLPLSGAIQFLALFNIILAAMGAYTFTRSRAVSVPGSLIASLAFAGSAMLQLSIEIPGIASVYGWLPWMLLALDRALTRRSKHWTVLSIAVCGLQMVAGHLQWVLYSYFLLFCWVLWTCFQDRAFPDRRARWLGVVRGFVILGAGILLAAVHLAPFMEMVALAGRSTERVSSNSWPLSYLLRLVIPEFFGTARPGIGTSLVFNDLWYVGLAPLLLAAAAPFVRKARTVVFWFVFVVLAVLITYGIGPFLYARWIPGLNSLLPMRIGYLFIFSVAVLAGLGFDGLVRTAKHQPKRAARVVALLVGLSALLLVTASIWGATEVDVILRDHKMRQVLRSAAFLAASWLSVIGLMLSQTSPKLARSFPIQIVQRLVIGALLLCIAFDLLTMAPGYNSYADADALLPRAPSVEWLQKNGSDGRLMGIDSPGPLFNPNTQALYGLYSVDGYDSLHPSRLDEFWRAADPGLNPPIRGNPYSNVFVRPQAYTSTLAELLNTRYVAASAPLPPNPTLQLAYNGEVLVYRNTRALGRAFLVGNAQVETASRVRELIADPAFDPKRSVLLEEQPISAVDSFSGGDSGIVNVTSYKRNSVELTAELRGPMWLVLTDPNYPGWHAEVDGQEQKIYTAYHLLRAIPLAQGNHYVRFFFLPSTLMPAGIVSASTLLILALTLVPIPYRKGREYE